MDIKGRNKEETASLDEDRCFLMCGSPVVLAVAKVPLILFKTTRQQEDVVFPPTTLANHGVVNTQLVTVQLTSSC